jgi:hypothetical protein
MVDIRVRRRSRVYRRGMFRRRHRLGRHLHSRVIMDIMGVVIRVDRAGMRRSRGGVSRGSSNREVILGQG